MRSPRMEDHPRTLLDGSARCPAGPSGCVCCLEVCLLRKRLLKASTRDRGSGALARGHGYLRTPRDRGCGSIDGIRTPVLGLERAVSQGETYARKYARDHPLPAPIHPPPAKDRKKTPRQVRDLPRGVDLPACLTGQCGNQAPPRPRRLHISYFARVGQGAGARWPVWPVSSDDRAGRSGPLSLTDIGQH